MRTFVTADLHGGHKALLQVFEKVNFDYKQDKLICLGDTCDGWSQVKETFEELLKIKNLVYIMGNHDQWFFEWIKSDGMKVPQIWTNQGGIKTLESFNYHPDNVSDDIKELLFNKARYFHIENKKLFIHGGYNWHKSIEEEQEENMIWDRHMFKTALEWHAFNKTINGRHTPKSTLNSFKDYDEIYIGHTSVELASYFNYKYQKDTLPLFLCNLIAMDTGAGWSGKLTLLDINTKEYVQSDYVAELYPEEKGRR